MKTLLPALALALSAFVPAMADVVVKNAWAKPTVPGQPVAAAYFEITASKAAHLLKVETPVAGLAEVHEMKQENGVMKMRQVQGLSLPAGQTVTLKPGGMHVMLMQLQSQLQEGAKWPLIVTTEQDGKRSQVRVDLFVRTEAPNPSK